LQENVRVDYENEKGDTEKYLDNLVKNIDYLAAPGLMNRNSMITD